MKFAVVNSEKIYLQCRKNNQIENIKYNVHADIDYLEHCKLNGAMLISKVIEHDSRPCVDSNAHAHRTHKFGMVSIPHHCGNGMKEYQYRYGKHQSHKSHHPERGGIHFLCIHTGLVGKTEERCFHAIRQNDEQYGYITVNIGNNSILSALGSKLERLYRNKQIVYELSRDTAQSINGSIFCQ